MTAGACGNIPVEHETKRGLLEPTDVAGMVRKGPSEAQGVGLRGIERHLFALHEKTPPAAPHIQPVTRAASSRASAVASTLSRRRAQDGPSPPPSAAPRHDGAGSVSRRCTRTTRLPKTCGRAWLELGGRGFCLEASRLARDGHDWSDRLDWSGLVGAYVSDWEGGPRTMFSPASLPCLARSNGRTIYRGSKRIQDGDEHGKAFPWRPSRTHRSES